MFIFIFIFTLGSNYKNPVYEQEEELTIIKEETLSRTNATVLTTNISEDIKELKEIIIEKKENETWQEKNNNRMNTYFITNNSEQTLEVQLSWEESKKLENGKYRVVIQCTTYQEYEKYIYAEFTITDEIK